MLKKKKKDFKNLKLLGLLLLICAISCVAVLFLLSFVLNKLKFSLQHVKATLVGNLYWRIVAIAFLGTFLFWIFRMMPKLFKNKLKERNEGEDAQIIYPDDLKKNELFVSTSYDKLNEIEDSNILRAEKVRGKLRALLTKEPTHTIVIGSTGSGKSTAFIDPIVQCLGQTKTLPSMVITDPKGELFNKHSAMLKERGYKISVINLADPYKSTRWNPFQNDIDKLQRLIEIDKEKDSAKYRTEMIQLEDEVYESVKDIIYTMCPITSKQDSSWQANARDFILGFMLALFEDARIGKITPQQINLFNLHFNVVKYANSESKDKLLSFFNDRDKFSKATAQAQTVLTSAKSEKTFASYLSEIQSYMSWIHDRGIQTLTATSELSFNNFDEQPNVLFLKIPDEKKTRHTLATVLILQCYKALVEKARKNEGTMDGDTYIDSARLKRRLYFLLDEFGNMPKFEDITSMISVARSRGIFFTFIVQSFEQLSLIYGQDIAKIVEDNCDLKVFLGTTSIATMEKFIKLGGQTKALSVSSNKSGESESVHATSLITISDLKTLNTKKDFGNALMSTFGQPMMLSKFTPSFKAKRLYKFGTAQYLENEFFDVGTLHFDIEKLIEVSANFKMTKGKVVDRAFNGLERLESQLVHYLDAEELQHYFDCDIYEKLEFCKMKKMSSNARSVTRFFSELIKELKYEKIKSE